MHATQTTPPSARPSPTWTRHEILRLGGGASPWEFLPAALRALDVAPEDLQMRLLVAANFAKVGLKTPARDHLASCPDGVLELPDIRGLRDAVESLPDDRVPAEARIAACRANLAALAEVVGDVNLEPWEALALATLVCRAADGNVVHRPADAPAGSWLGVGDHRQAAARFSASLAPRDAENPAYLEGADPPWTLAELLDKRAPSPVGLLARTYLIQADAAEFLDGLSRADLSARLASRPTVAFVGPDACARLRDRLLKTPDLQASGMAMVLQGVRSRCTSPTLQDALREVQSCQASNAEALQSRVTALYERRTPAWWKERYRSAATGGPPLRVLLPTSRFTTFLKHSATDLASAFDARGLVTRVLMEPDDSSKLSANAYLRAFSEFEPDLVVFINYPRHVRPGCFAPPHVPFVCWVQDAMPHLFSAELGRSQGPLDFTVGYTFPELFARYDYPRDRSAAFHLVADDRKFHPAPLSHDLRRRYACDVAYVSHQSETPDEQHRRLKAAITAKIPVPRTIDALREIVTQDALKPLSDLHHAEIRDQARDLLRSELGGEPVPQITDAVFKVYCQPLADRVLRHQTLDWAAQASRRRGWRLRIYGRGWERHPSLRDFAGGELEHGEDLRACYQSAGVHLHVCGQSLVHQRVMECLLSGGVPLCRFHTHERWTLLSWYLRRASGEGARAIFELRDQRFPRGAQAFERDATPALRELAFSMAALGVARDVLPSPAGRPDLFLADYSVQPRHQAYELEIDQWSAFAALGQRPEMFFHDPSSLEARIDAVLQSPALRADLNEAGASRARAGYTYAHAAARILDLVTGSLERT